MSNLSRGCSLFFQQPPQRQMSTYVVDNTHTKYDTHQSKQRQTTIGGSSDIRRNLGDSNKGKQS